MHAARSLAPLAALALAALVVAQLAHAGPTLQRTRRQLADDNSLQPLEDSTSGDDEQTREKRKLEGATQAKFGVKNAILGFVFGSGITSHHPGPSRNMDTTSGWRNSLRESTPGSKDQRRLCNSQDTHHTNSQSTPDANSERISSTSLNSFPTKGKSSGIQSRTRVLRQTSPTTTTTDIPVFDRNKVSLDLPGNLFGPSVSLLIRTTKIIGDVIQNSAVRYQTFLRLFRPLFRGPFEIKGLDPATTTTTTTTRRPPTTSTTTTSTTRPPEENEIRRRRRV